MREKESVWNVTDADVTNTPEGEEEEESAVTDLEMPETFPRTVNDPLVKEDVTVSAECSLPDRSVTVTNRE